MNLPKQITDMTYWPATPSIERLTRALELHWQAITAEALTIPVNRDGPRHMDDLRDLQIIAQVMDEPRWQEWAKQLFLTGAGDDRSRKRRVEMTAAVARMGESDSTIGLGFMTKKTPEAIWNQGLAVGFARLQRNPQWTGFSNQLPNIRGLMAIINESHDRSNSAGFVLMLPEEYLHMGLAEDREHIPAAEGNLIASILRHHGATEIYWNPNHPTNLYRITI